MFTLSFPPQEFCLACQGCCRFQDSRSPWRPKIYAKEECFSRDQGPLNADQEGYLRTRCVQGVWLCDHLDARTNHCQVYPWRPFECALYPFLLVRNKDAIAVALHLACPYVQEKKGLACFQDVCAQVKEFFEQKDVQSFLRSCKENIVSDHIQGEEVRIIFPVEL